MVQAYVIDTSALIQAFIEDTYTVNALELVKNIFKQSVVLHVSEFVLLECGNIVWKRTQFNDVSLETALIAVKKIQSIPIKYHLALNYLTRAVEIGIQHKLAVYDSIVISVAEALKLPLITHDKRQEAVAITLGITIKSLQDF
jgi:predicted nucleic acid-binding protein